MDITIYKDIASLTRTVSLIKRNQIKMIRAYRYLFIFTLINFLFAASIAVTLCVNMTHQLQQKDVQAQIENYFESDVIELAQLQNEEFELLDED